MREIASGLVVFVLLCASAGLGILIRPRLPEHHRTRETVELTQITIGLLVTFAAVVLGLLTASVKHGYDSAAQRTSFGPRPARHAVAPRRDASAGLGQDTGSGTCRRCLATDRVARRQQHATDLAVRPMAGSPGT